MKNIKEEALIWLRLLSFIGIWVLLLLIQGGGLTINLEAIKKLPDVVLIYMVLSFVGTKWLWKLRLFEGWLIRFPNLQGTWEGEIKSTEIDKTTGQQIAPIHVTIVIRHSFSTISCLMFSNESDSYSTTAQINEDDDSGIMRLTYNYINKPKAGVRERSPIHDGAAILRIIKDPTMTLEGTYWTSRKTTGDIVVKLKSRRLNIPLTA